MKFKVGDRVVLDDTHTNEFRGQKSTVVSEEEYYKHRKSIVMSNCVPHKLDNSVYDYNYYQTCVDHLILFTPSNYND